MALYIRPIRRVQGLMPRALLEGFGRRALELVIAHVRTRPQATELWLGHRPEPGNAGAFYQKLGFAYTGNTTEGGGVEMRLVL